MLEALFACVVVVGLPARAWRRFRAGAGAAPDGRYLLETALLTATLAVLLWRRGTPLSAVGLQPSGPARIARDVVICVGFAVGLDALSFWQATRKIRRAAPLQLPDRLFADTLASGRARASFLAVAIVGAAWEELCFRATVFLLVPATPIGLSCGALAGSLLFGAQHLRNGYAGLAYAFFFGLMFSALYLATHNLLAVVIAHAVGNILAVVQWAPRIEKTRQAAVHQLRPFLG